MTKSTQGTSLPFRTHGSGIRLMAVNQYLMAAVNDKQVMNNELPLQLLRLEHIQPTQTFGSSGESMGKWAG